MPKFFTFLGYWIGRFSQEEKRAHVHIMKFGSRNAMKIWLEPDIEIEYIHGINDATANKIIEEIRKRKDECLRKWHECERKSR